MPEHIFEVTPPEQDWLAMLMGEANPLSIANPLADLPRLYGDDIEFARVAFDELAAASGENNLPEFHPDRAEFTLLAPEDLRRRCEFIPQEAIPADWTFRLSTDRRRVMKAIAEARKKEGEWPRLQLFWELHPLMDWLVDKLLVRFGRHEAPLILSPRLKPGQPILLFQGVLSNRRSQPVISEWFGAQPVGGKQWQALPLEQVLAVTGFGSGLANPGKAAGQADLIRKRLPEAVAFAVEHMKQLRLERGQSLRKRLQEDQRKLKRWYDAAMYRLDAADMTARGAQAVRINQERKEIKALYQQRQDWLQDTLSTSDMPYIRLAAVFTGSK